MSPISFKRRLFPSAVIVQAARWCCQSNAVDRRPKRDPLHFDQAADLKDSSGSSLHDIGTARDPA